MTGLDELRAVAVEVAWAAAHLVRDQRPEGLRVAGTKSSAVDIVTEMDTAAERLIIDLLMDRRPADGLLGEEGGLRPGSSGLTWVIDPIDATVNYLYQVGQYAVSVGVVEGQPDPAGWRQLAGCVVDPVAEITYWASSGGGAYRDGRPLPGPNRVHLSQALVATGFGYLAHRRATQARVLAGVLPRVRDIRRFGCASLDLVYVAEGRLDAYYERGLNPWDFAAAGLIAAEAGVRVSGPNGRHPDTEMVVAAEPQLHRVLLDILGDLDAYRDGEQGPPSVGG